MIGCTGPGGAQTDERGFVLQGQAEAGEPAWGVLLSIASAGNDAEALAARYRAMLGRDDVWVRDHDAGAAVLLGRYASPTDRAAQRDLAWIQSYELGGRTPFRAAYLLPPEFADAGGRPEFNLEGAPEREGVPNAIYTLQVMAYEDRDRSKAKQAAEDAVMELRRRNEQAYYYHGPNRSMVTIGLFTESAFNPLRGQISPELQELRNRYPDNLVNGRQLILRTPDGRTRVQPSAVVLIPGQ